MRLFAQFGTICLYNLKNVKNTDGGMLVLVKLQANPAKHHNGHNHKILDITLDILSLLIFMLTLDAIETL